MKKMVKAYLIAILGVLFVWWLNMPFFDSHKDISYTIVTETPLIQGLVSELVGPEVVVKSIQATPFDRKGISKDIIPLVKTADLVLLDGFDEAILDQVRQNVSSPIELVTIKDILSKRSKQAPLGQYFWLSTHAWSKVSMVLPTILKQALPELRSEIAYRSTAQLQDVQELITQVSKKISDLDNKEKVFASNNPSFKAFASDFGLTFIDVSQVTEQTMKEHLDQCIQYNITTIFQIRDSVAIDPFIDYALREGVVLKKSQPFQSYYSSNSSPKLDQYSDMILRGVDAMIDGIKN